LGRPAVTVITTAFAVAAKARSRVLGMEAHPIVPVPHPLASRTAAEVQNMAAAIADQIVTGLTVAR
jgi:hypothetical protein